MSGVGLVWAEARGGVIGRDGTMPWNVPEDLAHFRLVTGSSPVIMGRRTWESLPERFRPLPGRANIVVTRRPDWAEAGATRAGSLDEALAVAGGARAWVIGGGQLYAEAIGRAEVLEVTRLDLDAAGDTYAPAVEGWREASSDPASGWRTSRTGIRYRFVTYRRDA